jgi:P-type Mg2+ transporter
MESVISASMIVLSIRTHKSIRHSKPSRSLLSATIAIVVITLLLPYTPLAGLLGFQALPMEFLLVLAALVGLYILCAETVKQVFYSRVKSQ